MKTHAKAITALDTANVQVENAHVTLDGKVIDANQR